MGVIYRCENQQHGSTRDPFCPRCHRKAEPIGHRTILKILLNPALRRFLGCHIVSKFQEDRFIGYGLRRVT